MPAEILLVGAGAIGAFYASRLAHAHDVTVSAVCRSNYAVVSARGFQILSPHYGPYTFAPARVFSSPTAAAASGIRWDVILVATKALPDVADDSATLDGLVGARTGIALVQNGLGVEAAYARRFPGASVLSGVTVAAVAQVEMGIIRHHRWTRITVGPWLPRAEPGSGAVQSPVEAGRRRRRRRDDGEARRLNERFVGWLKEGGVTDAEAVDHDMLQLVRWHKIAINAAMNPSSVLSGGTPNALMATDPEMAEHLRGIMQEVLDTAPKVLGVPWPEGGKFASAETILRSTRKNESGSVPSMELDWRDGKRVEVEVILGEPLRAARRRGLEMPRIQSLYAMLKMAQRNREAGGRSRL